MLTIPISHTIKPTSQQPALLRFFAQMLSYVFHPLFLPFYVCWFLAYMHPSYFTGFSAAGKVRVLLMVSLNDFGVVRAWTHKRVANCGLTPA